MYSLERDATKALNEFGIETQKLVEAANKEAERWHSAALELQEKQRVAGVRVMGVSSGGDLPTVLVSLSNSNAYEAERTICQQAGAWLNKNVSGTTLRLQRHRGNQPAADAGEITCP
jgi:ribosomal protein S12 methylthiotransferase accessory factor YcaO